MVTYSSNIDELRDDTRPSACLRLDAPSAHGGGTVGDRMARLIAHRIHGRGARGEGPDGYWLANAPSTAERKGHARPNIDTGQMLDPEHIAGEVHSDPGEVAVVYGTGEADDRGVSDRDRAHFAETGQSAYRIVRPFFWMTDGDCDELAEIAGDEWEAGAGGGGADGPAGPEELLGLE